MCGITTTISFHDFEGGYFLPELNKDLPDLDQCKKTFAESDVIILCVDVPSQITYANDLGNNNFYDSYTRFITEFIKENTSQLSANGLNKTVMILPIKCEGTILDTTPDNFGSYKQSINSQKNNTLYDKVSELYRDLFSYLKNEKTPVDSFYLPVITLGCVKANRLEYDYEKGCGRVSFAPVFKGTLRYYQCNCSSLLALCLWSAEAIITEKYKENCGLFTKIRMFFGGVCPTQWFRDALFKECSLHQILWNYISSQPDYQNLSNEVKSYFEEGLKNEAESQPFTGCRLI